MLSRAKPALGPEGATGAAKSPEVKKTPRLETFIQDRDYTGAITLLEVNLKTLGFQKTSNSNSNRPSL